MDRTSAISSPTFDVNDPIACAAAALALREDVARFLRSEFPDAEANAACGFNAERLARRALRGKLFDRAFHDGLAAAIADADARITEGSAASFETHDGWDEEGRETVHAVTMTVRTSEAERLDRAAAPARMMLTCVQRALDLLAARRAIGRLR